MVLEKTPESPLDSKGIKLVNPKGIFTRRTDAEAEASILGAPRRSDAKAEAPILWPPDAKSRLIEKTLMLGKTEGRRRRK